MACIGVVFDLPYRKLPSPKSFVTSCNYTVFETMFIILGTLWILSVFDKYVGKTIFRYKKRKIVVKIRRK